MTHDASPPKLSPKAVLLATALALLAALCFAGAARAGIGDSSTDPSFTLTAGGTGNDAAADVAITAANAWWVGQIRNTAGDLDATLGWCPYTGAVPYAATIRTYAGPAGDNDGFYDVAAKGAYAYAVGASRNAADDLDLLLVRWGTSGVHKWARRFAGASKKDDGATDVVVDGKGNAIVCGTTTTANGQDWVVLKYSTTGKRLWRWTFDGAGHGNDAPVEMVADAAGNIYVTGSTSVTSAGKRGALTVKLSPTGKKLWAKSYTGPDNGGAAATAIARNPRGGVYVAGWTATGATAEDVFALRYAANGLRKLFARYSGVGGLTTQTLHDIAVASNGSLVGAGSDDGSGSADALYLRWADGPAGSTPAPGTIVDTRVTGTPAIEWWSAVATDAFGGVYLTGRNPGPAGEASVLTRRLSLYRYGGEWSYAWYDGVHEREAAAIACYGMTVAICGKVDRGTTGFDQFFHYWQY